MSIAAVVVSLPERQPLLMEAMASVYAQTRPPDDLLVGVDFSRRGEVWNQNRLIDGTDAEWLAFLHDDDLWEPDHLAVAEQHFETADIIVADFSTPGRNWSIQKHSHFGMLQKTNWFPPSVVVARRSVFERWCEPQREPPYDWIDWANWRRLESAGARFVHTNVRTVQYRFGPWGNGSWRR